MSCTAQGAGTAASAASGLFGWAYNLAGSIDPWQQDIIACQQAVDVTRAMGLDPNDPNNEEILQTNYELALAQVAQVAGTEPLQNPIQKQADIILGTAETSTPIVNIKPPAPKANLGFIIAAFAVVAFGFLFVFR